MAYVSIGERRKRVEFIRGKITYWQKKLSEAEIALREAEVFGDPPRCMSTVCGNRALFRVNGTEEACKGHLASALDSAGGKATVEPWPWS